MTRLTILYCHGFASSAHGVKAGFLRRQMADRPEVDFRAVEFNPTPRDFEYLTVTGLVNRLRQYVVDYQLSDLRLIGSSLGALVALNYAHRFGGVDRLLLLAPALAYRRHLLLSAGELARWETEGVLYVEHYGFETTLPLRFDFHRDALQYTTSPPPPASVRILHGRGDEVIPIDESRRYAAAYPDRVALVELDADHGLTGCLEAIWENVQEFLL